MERSENKYALGQGAMSNWVKRVDGRQETVGMIGLNFWAIKAGDMGRTGGDDEYQSI